VFSLISVDLFDKYKGKKHEIQKIQNPKIANIYKCNRLFNNNEFVG
jgi:hypothetical protein